MLRSRLTLWLPTQCPPGPQQVGGWGRRWSPLAAAPFSELLIYAVA